MSSTLLGAACVLASLTLAACQMRFLAVGDWGDDSVDGRVRQQRVADAMDNYASFSPIDFIVSTGDNFYPDGVTSVDSPRFENSWRDVYHGVYIRAMSWYLTIGNHDADWDRRELYQVNYTWVDPEQRWLFPSLYHSWMATAPDGTTVHFVATDTDSLLSLKHQPAEQMAWIESQLAGSSADWIVAVGHHPAYNCGGHSGEGLIRRQVMPLLSQYGVAYFLNGHDHNLQHIVNTTDPAGDVETIITGAGGKSLYEYDPLMEAETNLLGETLVNFHEGYGFAAFEVYADRIDGFFYDWDAVMVHSFTKTR